MKIGRDLIEVFRDTLVGKSNDAFSEAMPAVHGAFVGREHQHGFAVFMLNARDNRVVGFSRGVKASRLILLEQRRYG